MNAESLQELINNHKNKDPCDAWLYNISFIRLEAKIKSVQKEISCQTSEIKSHNVSESPETITPQKSKHDQWFC